METICEIRRSQHTAGNYLEKRKYLFSFALKSGYHHVEIFPDHTQYLGFFKSYILQMYGSSLWSNVSTIHFYQDNEMFG